MYSSGIFSNSKRQGARSVSLPGVTDTTVMNQYISTHLSVDVDAL